MCRRLTGADADAADALQNTLISVARGLHDFDGRSRFSTWAYRIAVNASFDELRRRRRRADTPLEGVERSAPDETDLVDLRLAIDGALRSLSPELRAVVVLRDLCGLDYAEIAEVLRIPGGTVRSRIARGRGALVAALNEPATVTEMNAS